MQLTTDRRPPIRQDWNNCAVVAVDYLTRHQLPVRSLYWQAKRHGWSWLLGMATKDFGEWLEELGFQVMGVYPYYTRMLKEVGDAFPTGLYLGFYENLGQKHVFPIVDGVAYNVDDDAQLNVPVVWEVIPSWPYS